MLILIAILASPVTLNIPDGSWISPDYRMIEEWTLDPFKYTLTQRVSLGNISESEVGSEYTWDITLLRENLLYRFTDDRLFEEKSIDQPISENVTIVFSPNGKYLLLYNRMDNRSQRIDLNNFTSEQITLFDEPTNALISMADAGSIIALYGSPNTRFRILNSMLELVLDDAGFCQSNERLTHDESGDRFFCTRMNELIAFGPEGNELWTTGIDVFPDDGRERIPVSEVHPIGRLVACQDGLVIALTQSDKLIFHDGITGELILEEDIDARYPLFSKSGQYLACGALYLLDTGEEAAGAAVYELSNIPLDASRVLDSIIFTEGVSHVFPLAVSDDGDVLLRLYTTDYNYRYMLIDLTGQLLWVSSTCIWPSRGFSTANIGPVTGGMSNDGTSIWIFDGKILHGYSIERLWR